jgi:hypothetical protein
MRLGSSAVLFSLRGVPRFLVKGASTTRCASWTLPLPMVMGEKSWDLESLEGKIVMIGSDTLAVYE